MKFRKLLLAALIAAPFAAAAGLVLPPTTGYFTYGNTNSYSLPLLAAGYNASFGGGVGPGNPFYISSTPGAIQDQVVIYTGAGGTNVTHNDFGFENAYGAPNGHNDPYAFMNTSANAGPEKMTPPPDPKPATEIKNQTPNSWDASVAALRGFLKGGTPIFLFNNNETNADQTLAIWARLWLTNSAGTLVNRSLYLTNEHNDPTKNSNCSANTPCPYDANFVGGSKGGVEDGDATLFDGAEKLNPTAGTKNATDFVRSGGAVTSLSFGTINHNLGANQAAYAGVLPLLNTWLKDLYTLEDSNIGDTILDKYTVHLDLRLGCKASDWDGFISGNNGNEAVICKDVQIDNGYEQLFLVSSNSVLITVPEPGTLALVGAALAGLALSRRRREQI